MHSRICDNACFAYPPHTLEVSIATKLKALRLKAGKTQAQVAEAAGCLQSVIARYETGKGTPLGPRLAALAKALGVTVEDLLDESSAPETLDPKPHIHGNSLAAKIQDIFVKLPSEDQKLVYRQAEALLQRWELRKDDSTPKRRRKAA